MNLDSLLNIAAGNTSKRDGYEIILSAIRSGPKSLENLKRSVGRDDNAASLDDDAPYGSDYSQFFDALRRLWDDKAILFDGEMVRLRPKGYKFPHEIDSGSAFAEVNMLDIDCSECRLSKGENRVVHFCSACGSHARDISTGSPKTTGKDPAVLIAERSRQGVNDKPNRRKSKGSGSGDQESIW